MADVGWIVAFSSVCGSWCLQQEASMLERCQTPAIPMSGGNSLLLTCKPVGFSTPEAIPACFVTGWNSPSFWCVRTPQQCHNSLWPPRQQQKGRAEPRVPHRYASPRHTTPQPCAGKPSYFKLVFLFSHCPLRLHRKQEGSYSLASFVQLTLWSSPAENLPQPRKPL